MGSLKKGLAIGFVAGYVQGSKAGRDRYEQINRGWKRFKRTPGFQTIAGRADFLVGKGVRQAKVVAFDLIGKSALRRKTAAVNGSRYEESSSDL